MLAAGVTHVGCCSLDVDQAPQMHADTQKRAKKNKKIFRELLRSKGTAFSVNKILTKPLRETTALGLFNLRASTGEATARPLPMTNR